MFLLLFFDFDILVLFASREWKYNIPKIGSDIQPPFV